MSQMPRQMMILLVATLIMCTNAEWATGTDQSSRFHALGTDSTGLSHQSGLPHQSGLNGSTLLEAGHDSAPRILLQHTRSPQQRTRRARPRRALVSFLVDTAQQKYIQGATVLAKSSLRHAPGYFDARLLMVLNGRVYEESVLEQARLAGWRLKWVDPVSPPHAFEVPKSRDQFVKLRLWSLTDFDQVIYMDADVAFVAPLAGHIVSQAAYPTQCKIWAARDMEKGKWLDTFNMGVAGLRPNMTEYERLMDLLMSDRVQYEHIMSEKGFLNAVYATNDGGWCELDFEKNANLVAYTQAREYWDTTTPQVVHYTQYKPWACGTDYQPVCDLWNLEQASPAYPVTVISGYFAGKNKHGGDQYASWGKNFFAHQVPLVFFTDDAASVPGLLERLNRAPNITKVVVVQRSSFYTSQKMFDWDQQLKLDSERKVHSTHLFQVWLEKTNFVTTAIGRNFFRSDHYVWVDYGCFRTEDWGSNWAVHAERFPVDSHRMLLLDVPRAKASKWWFGMTRYSGTGERPGSPKQIGGTIFGGSKVAWKLWHTAFYNTVRRQYRKGVFIGDDQIPMSVVAAQHPRMVCRIQPRVVQGSEPWFFLQWYLAGKAVWQQCQ